MAEGATRPDEGQGIKKSQWQRIESVIDEEISQAKHHVEANVSGNRKKRWQRFYGDLYGNEKIGRSKYVSRDTMEAVDWIMPGLVRTFCGGEPKIEIDIEGQDPIVGKALMAKMDEDFAFDDESSRFLADTMWIKDALVSGLSFQKSMWVKDFEYEVETFDSLNYEQMVQIDSSPDMEFLGFDEEDAGLDIPLYRNVKVRIRKVKRNGLDIAPIPYWEMLWSEKVRYINDEHGKGHVTKMTLDQLRRINRSYSEGEEDFFQGLEKLEERIALSKRDDPDDEQHMITGKEEVSVCEWYDMIDVDSDEYLEPIIVWFVTDYPNKSEYHDHQDDTESDPASDGAAGVLLRWELNDSDFIPISELKAIIDPYKFEGISFVDKLIDLQNLKTQIFRRILENFDFNVLGRWIVGENSNVDIRQLAKHIPGDVIEGDPDKIKMEGGRPFDASSLTLLEYIDLIKENRTGQSRVNQGTDTQSMNRTATGISLLQNAAQQIIGLIERTLAETGFSDRTRKAALLYRENISEPFTVEVNGRQVTINPEQLQGTIRTKVNMAMEAQSGFEDAQKVERLFAFLSQMNQAYPGLLGPDQVHNLATRYVRSLGDNNIKDYVVELQAFTNQIAQNLQQQQQAQQFQMQVQNQEMQNKMMEARAKMMSEATKLKELGVDLNIAEMQEQTKVLIKQMDVEQKNHEAALDYRVGVLNQITQRNNTNDRAR